MLTEKVTEQSADRGVLIAVGASALYTLGMGAAWLIGTHPYADAHLLLSEVWWVIAALAACAYAAARVMRVPVQQSRAFPRFAWLLIGPVLLSVGAMLPTLLDAKVNWPIVASVVVGTMFVGIGEEIIYRGIALNLLARRFSTTVSVIASSILFGLLHSVNAMLQPVDATIVQVVVTTCVGLLFAWVYVATRGNLVLLVVAHWWYDTSLIVPQATGTGQNLLGGLQSLLLILGGIGATVHGMRTYRGQRWADISAS